MRIVIDTNLLISGVISAGLARQLMEAVKTGEFEWCTSEVLLAEFLDVMARDKFASRLALAGLTPQAIVDDLRTLAWVVSPTEVARVVPSDTDDDHVLAAALSGAVDLIVTGDKRDLLALGSYQGIPIVTARQAMERIATNE